LFEIRNVSRNIADFGMIHLIFILMKPPQARIPLTYDLLEMLAIAMNDSTETTWYLDTWEGEVFCDTAEHDDQELVAMIEGDVSGERFIPVPAKQPREGWQQMERFILALDERDEQAKNLLLTTIQCQGAFGRFKDTLFRLGWMEQWYEFKEREDTHEALEWLRSLELIASEEMVTGMKLYETHLMKRWQREKDIASMTAGASVQCIETIGHEDKLTRGKILPRA